MAPYDPYIAYKDLTVDLRAHRVRRAGCELCLTPREFALLAVLVTHCDKALSRSQLLEAAWGYAFIGESRTVDVHINRLRRKLGLENRHPDHLQGRLPADSSQLTFPPDLIQ